MSRIVQDSQTFREDYYLHFLGRRVSRARNQQKQAASRAKHARKSVLLSLSGVSIGSLLSLLFDLEDGSYVFLRKV
jgi:hypothetical protein